MYMLRQHGVRVPRRSVRWLVYAGIVAVTLPVWTPATALPSDPFTIHTSLKSIAHVTGGQLDNFIRSRHPSSPLIGLGQTWVDTGQRYQINAFYLMAHALHESAWGTSRLARHKHNIYGWHAFNNCPYSCATAYHSKVECILKVMPELDRLYLSPDGRYYTQYGPTLRGVNVHYATDKHWKYVIAAVMNEAARFAQAS
ncbi:MAG: glucosaminidase domain-containing protein [Herpetosiphonaceae bacterium]|nr:glucosaminidase domain-containing protein [Herpetosiphonaceae bacterium]